VKSDDELIAIARDAVPEHLKSLGRIVRREPAPEANRIAASGPRAAAATHDDGDSLIESLAHEVGAELAPATEDSADVEFVEHTKLGAKSTVVQIRSGKVARVLKRA
jgi:hypothetical protein